MRRITPWILSIGMVFGAALTCAFADDACKRDDLKSMVVKYFAALEARDHSSLPLAANVKFTENGVTMPMGQGLWQTAGKVVLKRDLLDTLKCGTHSNVVIEEKYTAPKTPAPKGGGGIGMNLAVPPPADGTVRPILYGVRLKVADGKISEIESFVARETEFAFNAPTVLTTKDQDWESIIPVAQRSSRLAMIAAADDYYDMFSNDEPEVHTPFASPCDRWENGFMTTAGSPDSTVMMTAHDCSPKGLEIKTHGKRRFLVDVEAGTVVAYVHFAGGLPDFHMFRMRNGKVDLIQAVIGAGSKDMGWPEEPICK